MRIATVATSLPAEIPGTLPFRLEQRASRASSLLKLGLILPAAVALLLPFAMVALALIDSAEMRAMTAEHPVATLQIAIGLAFWTVLFGWPLQRITASLANRRQVACDEDDITVTDTGLMGARSWREPLNGYLGLAHHVRSSLSGIRHELILAHPDRSRSVLLAIAPSFSQGEIDALSGLIGCRQIPARALYSLSGDALMSGLNAAEPVAVSDPVTSPA